MRSVPSELLEKLHKNIQTKGSQAQPKMNVAVARAKTTVTDSSYWTVEKIREKTGLGDIAVAARRYSKHYGRPDRLYEIHVDNGQVKTAIREYPDKLKQGWQDQFALGPGTDVAIAFDGEWELYRKVWRQRTHENPWIFWVDDLGVLWGQLWDDETTLVELTTGVSKVTAIRGWKEFDNGLNDQGIVVAFVKTDGTVWYRNYCIQVDLTYIWESQRQVTGFTGTATNVGLFLTNDYRLGVLVENTLGKIWWLVTGRLWVGMAIERDFLKASISDVTFEVLPIQYLESHSDIENISANLTDIWFNVAEPIYPVPVFAENPDGDEYTILLRFSHPIDYDLSLVGPAFSIKDSVNANFTILSTAAGFDNSEIIFTLNIFSGASGNMFINYDRTIIELDSVNQGSRFAIESFSFEFTPDLAPPEGHAFENITVSILPTFVVSQVYYRNGYASENITASIADVTFVVTKVGSNPL